MLKLICKAFFSFYFWKLRAKEGDVVVMTVKDASRGKEWLRALSEWEIFPNNHVVIMDESQTIHTLYDAPAELREKLKAAAEK